MSLPVILLGGGGHSRVLADILRLRKIEILGVADPKIPQGQKNQDGLVSLGGDDAVKKFSPKEVCLVNGVGSSKTLDARRGIYETFKAAGYRFLSVIHPAAIIAGNAELKEGVQVMAGAIVQAGSIIAENSIINTKASVDHDCRIGKHVHIAPGATICGTVTIGDSSHIGAATTIIQGVTVGEGCFIRAGSLVVKNTINIAQGAF